MGKFRAKIVIGYLAAAAVLVLSNTASAEDKKEIGQRLLDNAQKISDIRADGSPAFRMEVKFKITSNSAPKETEGKYAEIWVSKAKWRREVETPSFHRLEVALPSGSSAYLDAGTDPPDTLSDRMLLRFPKSSPEIKNVAEREVSGVKASCVESKVLGAKSLDCVDSATGVSLFREIHHPSNVETCWYRDYQKFGDRLFPRSVHCLKNPGDEFEVTVSELSAETSPDESLFVKPAGAVNVGAQCQGARVAPPKLAYDPDPISPRPFHGDKTVMLSTVIGLEGHPQDLRVTNSAGEDFDRAALNAVRSWRFQAATCDGVPVRVLISVQVNFHMP